jgi:hypothetical protein
MVYTYFLNMVSHNIWNLFFLPTYLPLYENVFPTELVTKVKPNINSVEVHPQLSHNWHPVDGWCAGGVLFVI